MKTGIQPRRIDEDALQIEHYRCLLDLYRLASEAPHTDRFLFEAARRIRSILPGGSELYIDCCEECARNPITGECCENRRLLGLFPLRVRWRLRGCQETEQTESFLQEATTVLAEALASIVRREELSLRKKMANPIALFAQSRPFETVVRVLAEGTESREVLLGRRIHANTIEYIRLSAGLESGEFLTFELRGEPSSRLNWPASCPGVNEPARIENAPHPSPRGDFLMERSVSCAIGTLDGVVGHLLVANADEDYSVIHGYLLSQVAECLSPYLVSYAARDEALLKAEERHQRQLSLFNSISEIISITDPESGEILFANDRFFADWGTLPDIADAEILRDGEYVPAAENPNEWMPDEEPRGQAIDWNFRNTANNRWYHCFDRKIPWPDGRNVRFQLAIDVTARVEARQRLIFHHDLLEAILDVSAQGSWDWDIETGSSVFDRRWKAMIGYGENELESNITTWSSLCHPDDIEQAQQKLLAHWERDEPYSTEIRMKHKEGHWVWILARGRLVERGPGGKPRRMIGTHLDITNLKELQLELVEARDTAENANRAKDDFLAIVSHEMRTPLNSIIGFADLLIDETTTPTHREYADAIREGGKRLNSLVGDILNYARLGGGLGAGEYVEFDLGADLDEIARELGGSSRTNRFFVEWSRNATGTSTIRSGTLVLANRVGIHEVLTNLLRNAFNYTENGTVILRPRLEDVGNEVSWLCIEVEDTGRGIPPEELERLLKPFEQGTQSSTRNNEGIGLGLAIVQKIVSSEAGHLDIRSSPGEGSTFTARIPVKVISLP